MDRMFVGAKRGVEAALLEAHAVPHRLLPGRGWRGASLPGRLAAPVLFGNALVRSLALIRSFRPDVVVATGGFASAAVAAAAILARRPLVLQEQNSVPGLVNRRLARWASLVLLAYESSRPFLPRGVRCRVVGNPIRFRPERTGEGPRGERVLVLGGSRGARSINRAMVEAVPSLLNRPDLRIDWVSGERDYEWVAERVKEWSDRVRVMPYEDRLDRLYREATVAVSRAGASSVFELAAFGVPTIFVPYPFAADDHQRFNVAPLVELGAAETIPDRGLSGNLLARKLASLLDDPDRRRRMGEAMRAWARPNAADEAARAILEELPGWVKKTLR
jgi:UDP-N-acetylglucosamine--N-acetylmuramyl-(pentapeptide) pyrophosphoryl-undecaprenol N-acetylglucosamine transferase